MVEMAVVSMGVFVEFYGGLVFHGSYLPRKKKN